MRRILILGGTREAVELANRLAGEGYDVITSLAGVTREPVMPMGAVRRGGFGGADGLSRFLKAEGIAALIDATHPFAVRISRNAAEAAQIPVLRLERPAWKAEANWIVVNSVTEAVAALPAGARVFLTIGRQAVAEFFARRDISGVARMIEALGVAVPGNWRVILQRPPFTVAGELALIESESITHLVSKNAGGAQTEAKLMAARERNLPVVMIDRPPKPVAPTFATISDLVAALRASVSP